MARPFKSGLDYFPLDVHDDDKMKFIRIKFKIIGVAIVFELYRKIYSQGFFANWTNDEALIFADSIKSEFNVVQNVVDECVNRGIFDCGRFKDFNILTSKGIQDRFAEATWRRKNCKYNFNFFVNGSKLDTSRGDYVDTNLVNVDNNPSSSVLNADKSTQSKVKESKVNKSKEIKNKQLVNPLDLPKPKNEAFLASCKKGFESWWELYDKKTHKKDALIKWLKLTVPEMKKAMAVVEAYTEANPKEFRKDPHRYLAKKSFNDEIIVSKEKQGEQNFKDALKSLGYGPELNEINEQDEVIKFRKLMEEPINGVKYEIT